MKKLLSGFLLFLSINLFSQSFPPPAEFLGYELGEQFTPNHKIEAYFRLASIAAPDRVRVEQYGTTYEGRPLIMAVVGNVQNISRLEAIRQNNLKMAGMLDGAPDLHLPVVIWLSYNVHGNEASSSEVAMKALYALANSRDPVIDRWLQSVVIIIDPCLNPDGRDRYVNWYNQVVGKHPNPSPSAREHIEPWPGGRSNHYNFDLNRDWAWQSQVETQQRIKVYNRWMPQIHVDFHEQYPGSPYYFAPAAEPLHEVITPFQRSFQVEIGKNHAKYFDEKGWLFFTREYFDLFYPAYGDTYPMYNGSIGMTYEQAGHGVAGLAYALDGIDTLKLRDRIEHHFTTTMSTIETGALHAFRINTEFRKYFEEAEKNGNGNYKTYVVRGNDAGKLRPIIQLFNRNNIKYSVADKTVRVNGLNYFTNKEENYNLSPGDLIIPGVQPKAALVRVLFEPTATLSDSATYDITAWSLPYAYGIESFALKTRLSGAALLVKATAPIQISNSVYGYLIPYTAFSDGKLLAGLVKNGFRVRFAEKDFRYDNKIYKKGTLVLLRSGNEQRWHLLESLVNEHAAAVFPVSSGFMESGFDFGSDKLHLLRKPSVAVVTGKNVNPNAAGEVWHLFDQQLGYPVTLINLDDLADVQLSDFSVLILPDGNYKFLSDKELNGDLKNWIRQGGKLIAMERAVAQMAASDWGIKMKKDEEDKGDQAASYDDLKKYGNRELESIENNIPGAIFKLELDNSHPLAFGYPEYYFTLKLDAHMYSFMKDGWNVGVMKKENQVSGFVGSKLKPKLQDGTTIAVQQMGRGTIVYFADNPIFRSFWENGKLLFTNAVFFVGQ